MGESLENNPKNESAAENQRAAWNEMAGRLHPNIHVKRPLSRFPSKSYTHAKRLFDIVLSAAALVVLSPVLAGCAIAVRRTSAGPIIFRQERWGRSGKTFVCYKFRTMLAETPADKKATEFENKQSYMTPIGNTLRRWSLDELPQLVNVLKGDMSLIGPRPVIIAEERLIELRRPLGADWVRPGLSGWAQVNGRNLVDDEEKAFLDGEYVANMSLAFDARIFLKSIAVVVGRTGVDGKAKEPSPQIVLLTDEKDVR